MRRRRFYPPPHPKEAERQADFYDAPDVDEIFRCKHGVDKGEQHCLTCDEEAAAALGDDFWDAVDREWDQREGS